MIRNKYDPRLKKYDELDKTFVCGEHILKELLNELEPGKNKKLSNQSWIITGPRGAGKSHLLILLYKKIMADKKLSAYWHPLAFPEELFNIDSLYRLLLRIFENIFSNNDVKQLEEHRLEFHRLKKLKIKGNLTQKKEEKHWLSKALFELLAEVKKTTGKKFILMLENLQYIFKNQLSIDDLKHLRGFMNENPNVLIIIGTALAIFDEIENYEAPFFHFFRLRSLDSLDDKGIVEFLCKIAFFRNDTGINERIENNIHFIYIYRLLTGGNPRSVLFLYEHILNNEHLNTDTILENIMELTPYFREKTLVKSSQKKLILNTLAAAVPAMTATEIAEYINEEQKSIVEQLKRLAAEGWVREIPIRGEKVKRKEVFYALQDYSYRVWYKIRMMERDESDIYYLAELAAILMERKKLEEPVEKYPDIIGEETLAYGEGAGFSLAISKQIEKEDIFKFRQLKTIANSVFNSSEELKHLSDETSELGPRLESVGRLLLMGKFIATTDLFDLILEKKKLPEYGMKKLEFFLEACILDILSEGEENGEIKILIRYWILLVNRTYDSKTIKNKFLEFVYLYIEIAGKENISLNIIEDVMGQLYSEGIEISDIIIKIVRAVKNPNTREAQTWMADLLFAEIVKQLSK